MLRFTIPNTPFMIYLALSSMFLAIQMFFTSWIGTIGNICLLGFHDYEAIASKTVYGIVFDKKICLKCGHIHDEVAEEELEMKREEILRKSRKDLAQQLYQKKQDNDRTINSKDINGEIKT